MVWGIWNIWDENLALCLVSRYVTDIAEEVD